MVKFCDQCGTKLKDDDAFCHNCGNPTDGSKRKNSGNNSGGLIDAIKRYEDKNNRRKVMKKKRKQQEAQERANEQIKNEKPVGALFYVNGRDASLSIFEDYVELDFTGNDLKELLSGFGGVKRIYYTQISSIQKRDAGINLLGSIEFEVPGMAQSGRWGHKENVVHYSIPFQQEVNKIFEYVNKKLLDIQNPKKDNVSVKTDNQYMTQLKEAKELLDMDVLSQEEFDEIKEYYLAKIRESP